MRRVLVATYGGAHVAVAIALHRALIEAGLQPVMLGLTTAAEVLRRQGIPVIRFLDHVDLGDPQVRRWGDYLCGFHHREGIGISRQESMAYLGAGLAELVDAIGEEAALARYRDAGLNALLPIGTLRRILAEEMIDGVIATDSPRAERAALNAAALTGRPSVCVVAAFPHIGLHYLKRGDNGAIMCVLNQRFKEQLVLAGRAPDSVVVTGNPAFDSLVTDDGDALRASLRAGAGIAPGEWTVLWAEQPEPDNPDLPLRVREHLGRLCRSHGWRLIVRLHPSSQAASSATAPEGALISPRNESARDALLKSDAIVTLTSTIGFEALVLDKPLLIVAMSQYSAFVDYRDADGAWVVDSFNEIEQALLGFFQDDPTARALAVRRRAMPRHGRAASAVVDCLTRQWAQSSAQGSPTP